MTVTPPPAPAEPPPEGARLRRPEWVAHVLDDGRAVLLHLPSAKRRVLSPEATAIWQAVVASGSEGATSDEVSAVVGAAYPEADPDVIAHDVGVFLGELLATDLVEVVP